MSRRSAPPGFAASRATAHPRPFASPASPPSKPRPPSPAAAKRRHPSPHRASSILRRFRQHLDGRYTIIEITPALLAEAARLANAHPLRASDAVQLAAALAINRKEQDAGFAPVTLISADQALNDAATAEGLTVDDPRSHP